MRVRTLVLTAAVLAALALSGCKPPPPKTVIVTLRPVVIAPGVALKGAPLPKGFPSEVPMWPNAVVKSAETAASSGGKGRQWGVQMVAPLAYAKVIDGTLRGAQQSGWTVADQTDLSTAERPGGMLTYSKGKISVTATIQSETPSSTVMSLVVTSK